MEAKLNLTKLGSGWVKGTYKGYFFHALVFGQSSVYGISEGRTSKLTVCLGDKWDSERVVFNYDRGMALDHEVGHEIAKLLELI